MKHKIKFTLLSLLLTTSISFIPSNANEIPHSHTVTVSQNSFSFDTYTNKLEWRYKMINGKLYKRLFNHSTVKWETDWILVG